MRSARYRFYRSSICPGSVKKACRILMPCRYAITSRVQGWDMMAMRLRHAVPRRAGQLASFIRYLIGVVPEDDRSLIDTLYVERMPYSRRYRLRNRKVKVYRKPSYRFVARFLT